MKIPSSIRRFFSFMPRQGGGVITCDGCGTRWLLKRDAFTRGAAALHLLDHAIGHETCVSCGQQRRHCGACSERGD